ncbi:methyl-accepting chemotaxis protein [Oscillospiraceae bacterium OttesenSCG-928-G22]|nr:methyl-accepting chemotaxis protein [Oscillospiraceae bacterium OttesenSCG-928-G22]
MKLSKKLILSLMIIAAIGMIIGLIGVNGMFRLSEEDEEMYRYNTLPMRYLAEMYDTLASQRICANNMVIFREADPQFAAEEAEALTEKESLFTTAFSAYSQTLSNEREEELYNNMKQLYENDFKTIKADVRAAVASGDEQRMADAIQAMDSMGSDISGYMDEAFVLNEQLAAGQVDANRALFTGRTVILVLSVVAGIVVSVIFALFLAGVISKPINRIMDATKQVATSGNMHFSDEVLAAIKHDAQFRDETGQLADAFSSMMDALIKKSAVLETLASGDLTPDVPLAGHEDTIGNAITLVLENMNDMFSEINQISAQVAVSSGEIAHGSQALAQGASEQAATVEKISASIAEITHQSDTSVETAREAFSKGELIRSIAMDGNQKMQNMMGAVRDINDASKSIERVIKAIDDIAFQTNILALNAAVEAARAGQHGKGFAVVAEEVRSLAAKSADAAKETADLISANIEKAELGLSISNDTAQSLQQIIEGIQQTTDFLNVMADQSESIRTATQQVNVAVEQVALVVQQNSATSEESAASSEEMSGQAQVLRDMVARFKLKNLPQSSLSLPPAAAFQADGYALNSWDQ